MSKFEYRSSKETRKAKVEGRLTRVNASDWPKLPSESANAQQIREGPGGEKRPANYDLEERTARFGEAIIELTRTIPRGPANDRLIDQLVGCGTSIGANYAEAVDTLTKKEFIQCIGRCRRESRETRFFLRMVAKAAPSLIEEARRLWLEARELNLIFGSMIRRK